MSESQYSSLISQATLYLSDSLPGEALASLHAAVEIARTFGKKDKRLAAALELRAAAHKQHGDDLNAERDIHEAVTIRLALMGRRAEKLAHAQKYDEAETLYRDSLDVCRRTFGDEHRETATCLDNLAGNLRSQSRFQEAFIHAHEALDIRRRILGDDHAHTATSCSNLGYLYRLLGRYDDALELLVMSLKVREKRNGSDHPLVAESLDRIASVYRDTGRFDEALPLCKRALRIRSEAFGQDHPLTAASKNNLALILERRSDDAVIASARASVPPQKSVPVKGVSPPRENHAAGYAILAALGGGLPLAAAVFFFVPWLSVAMTLVVVIFSLVSFVAPDATEAVLRRVKGLVRDRVLSNVGDRDASPLGRAGGRPFEIGPATRSSELSLETVRQFPSRAASETLDLYWVKSITQAAADELAGMRCGLRLNGLQELPSKLAKALRVHEGCLELNGVSKLTVPAAMAIARHQGPSLQLNGLSEAGPELAEHLAHHRGTLSLHGLRSVDEQAATWLVKHRGELSLMGLQLVSQQTVRILRSSPLIRLPESLGDGI